MNKKIVLDFEANFNDLQSKMKSVFDEISKNNDKVLGSSNAPTSSMSSTQRLEHERERAAQSRQKVLEDKQQFYDKYTPEQRKQFRSKEANPFDPETQRFLARDKKSKKDEASLSDNEQKISGALKENSETLKRQNVEQTIRHKEYRGLSDKQLRTSSEDLKLKSREALKGGDTTKAEAFHREKMALDSAGKFRKNVMSGEDDGGAEGSTRAQTRFMRQTARNLIVGQMIGGAGQMMGHGTQQLGQVAQTGFQGYSSAAASGMSAGGSGLVGIALLAAAAVGKLVMNGEEMAKQTNKVGAVLDKTSAESNFSSTKSGFEKYGGLSNVGLGGVDDKMMLQQESIKIARQTGYGGHLMERTVEENLLKKTMGLEGGDLGAFTKFERGSENSGAAEGTMMFTKMLQQLNTGITLGDKDGVGKDLSRLPKYLEKLLQINEKTFQITGSLTKEQNKANMMMLGGATSLGGIFKDERNSSELVNSIQQSFAAPRNEEAKYKQMEAMRQANPNMGEMDLLKLSENMVDPKTVNNLYKNSLKEFGVDKYSDLNQNDQTRFNAGMGGLIGTNYTKGDELFKKMDANSGMSTTDMLSSATGDEKENITKKLYESAEKLTTNLEKAGSMLGDKIEGLSSKVGKLTEAITDWGFFGKSSEEKKFEEWLNKKNEGGAGGKY